MSNAPVVLTSIADGVATVTLNRPGVRNALNRELLSALPQALTELDKDEEVRVVVLTGADPAFCAGLDLKEVGSQGLGRASDVAVVPQQEAYWPWPDMTKPVIGAINGPAVTGGLELALWCDFLIASDRAFFADTHARVGIMPGWGLTVLLPQAVGLRRAKFMSLTGNFVGAAEGYEFGLVARVVPHDQLLAAATAIAREIVSNDDRGVSAVLGTYKVSALTTAAEAYQIEHQACMAWQEANFDRTEVERRRGALVARGRSQVT
jgi:enoyl-CoA hydratase